MAFWHNHVVFRHGHERRFQSRSLGVTSMTVNPMRNATFFIVLFAILQRPRSRNVCHAAAGQPGPAARCAAPAHRPVYVKDFYKDKANWMDKRYYRCNILGILNSFGR